MYLMCRSVNRGDQPLSLKSVCRAESGYGSGILLDFRETFFFFSSFFFLFKLPATCLVLLFVHFFFFPHWLNMNQCMCIPEYIHVQSIMRLFL